ncbi:MAG: L,D-transpeptidase [Chloroflexi bacterium]|nr:L,D-transpeptidase [Chloroflexota bacterium]
MTPQSVSRRDVLKSIAILGLGAGSVAFVGLDPLQVSAEQAHRPAQQANLPELPPHWHGEPLGRITSEWMNARVDTNIDADVVSQLRQDDIVRVRRVVRGQTVFLHNDIWLETNFGYFYSSFVQPVWYHLPNVPVADLGEGRWAEVTVPYTDAYWDPDSRDPNRFVSRMYYGGTFRVRELLMGEDGRSWYKVDELYQSFYMRATHLRLIPDADLAPISPDLPVSAKWMDVDLTAQTLTAYENDSAVWRHRIATGRDGKQTPEGTFYIFDKRISERMVNNTAADEDASERYNLAGVPFVCYFTDNWVATHGCYWHNDYGQPRSAGCVNLPAYAARWVWRWTAPHPPLDAMYYRQNVRTDGTRVVVHY